MLYVTSLVFRHAGPILYHLHKQKLILSVRRAKIGQIKAGFHILVRNIKTIVDSLGFFTFLMIIWKHKFLNMADNLRLSMIVLDQLKKAENV